MVPEKNGGGGFILSSQERFRMSSIGFQFMGFKSYVSHSNKVMQRTNTIPL